MMNRWTLQFPDKILEAEYRLKTQTRIGYPVFMVLAATGMLDMFYGLVDDIVKYQMRNIMTDTCLLVLSIVTVVIVQKNHKFVNIGLLFLILAYLVMATVLLPQANTANIATQAYCLMITNCIILCIQDFKFGVLQIICTLLTVLMIQLFDIGIASISLLSGFIWLSLIMMYCIYKLQQQTRQFFLLSQKDSNFQTILSQIATRPFVIFDFDQEQFKFKSLYNHEIRLPDALSCIFNKKIFGDFIYSRQKENNLELNGVYREDLTLKYQDKLVQVNYSEFYLSQKTFMIIFNTKINDAAQNIASDQISTFINSNIKAYVQLLQVKQRKGSQILSKICLNNLIAQKTLMYISKPHFTFVNLSQTLRKYLKLLELACAKIKCSLKATESQGIVTVKPLLCLILIEILIQFKDCSIIYCILETQQKSIIIKFHSNQFYIHKPIQHVEDALKYIITSFNEVPLGFELTIETERPD